MSAPVTTPLRRTIESVDFDPTQPRCHVEVTKRDGLRLLQRWRVAFATERKDHRYYELVEDTLHPEFDHRYFVLKDASGEARSIQPFFLVDQDLLVGLGSRFRTLIDGIRKVWPRFMRTRVLMVGCVAGEGHLDGEGTRDCDNAQVLSSSIADHARALGARIVVLKEFPARYRSTLGCFLRAGFTRVPSMPMTRLCIDYPSFEDYMQRALNSATRRKLRKKFHAAERSSPIQLSVVDDVTPVIAQVYPLYLQVYQRSMLHFEKLTEAYFRELGRRMSDKVRFFVWRQEGRIVGFAACMLHGDALYAEYIGLDYAVALDLHIYHYAVRDMIRWAIANGYKWFHSSGLNYDPKLHLRHALDPVDLYVMHTSRPINALMKHILPLIEPTRYDKTLAKFSNYDDLWAAH